MKKKLFFTMLLLLMGVSMQAQSIATEQMTKPDAVKFCVVQKDGNYMIEPALKKLTSDDFIPISQLVNSQTMENFNKSFHLSFTPGGNATGSALKIYSAFIQMMPLNNTQWGM